MQSLLSGRHRNSRPFKTVAKITPSPGVFQFIVSASSFPQQGNDLGMNLKDDFQHIDTVVAMNTTNVLSAIQSSTSKSVSGSSPTKWQHAVNGAVANIMGTEAAVASMRLLSGTHAISAALFACLRPGDELFCASGAPYDTLEEVIGIRRGSGHGTLAEFGISFRCHDFPVSPTGVIDEMGLHKAIQDGKPKVCHIQRSCGYSLRPTLTIHEIKTIIQVVRGIDPSIIISVDNCYGEFTETFEPGHAGADIVMGSFIKNPGGTLATGGGYIAGREDIVSAVCARWGSSGEHERDARALLHGLWLAPARVGEALKGGRLIADYARESGLMAMPQDPTSERPSFITAIQLDSADRMVQFCEVVQRSSPVGSYVKPVAGSTPGYHSQVIFADGTFIDGCTSELSADGPLRPPFVVYCQGGTHWTHWLNVTRALLRNSV